MKSGYFGPPIFHKGKKSLLGVDGWKWEFGCHTAFVIEHSPNQTPREALKELINKVLSPPPEVFFPLFLSSSRFSFGF